MGRWQPQAEADIQVTVLPLQLFREPPENLAFCSEEQKPNAERTMGKPADGVPEQVPQPKAKPKLAGSAQTTGHLPQGLTGSMMVIMGFRSVPGRSPALSVA